MLKEHLHTLIVALAFTAALVAYVLIAIVVSASDASALRDVLYLLAGATAGTAGTSLVK